MTSCLPGHLSTNIIDTFFAFWIRFSVLLSPFSGESDRDVFNEKPSREEILAATQVSHYFQFIVKMVERK